MENVLFLDSVLKEKPYGSNRIQKKFHIGDESLKIGEYWAISAHDNGLSVIKASGVKDGWLTEKEDLLTNLLNGINAETKIKDPAKKEKADADGQSLADKSDLDEIFGDKKKW